MGTIKVLYLYDNYPSYRKDFFEELNKELITEGKQFAFYYGSKSNNASRQETTSSFPLKRFEITEKKCAGIELLHFKGLKKAFKLFKPDIVVLQFHVAILSYWWAFLYMKCHHIPYVIWDCNYTRDNLGGMMVKIRRMLVDLTYKRAAACITYGSVFRNYLINMGRAAESVFIAQNTINIQNIFDSRSPSCDKRSFNHSLRFLYVGALLNRKYVDSAIIAISRLIDEGFDIYFDIIGEGPERAKLEGIINGGKHSERIIMHGSKHGSEVKKFFEEDDVFLLPGTGGLAINEAMAYSMPLISTVGDDTIVDLIDGNGFLLKELGNIEDIYSSIKRFIQLPQDEKVRMSHRSEQIVKEKASLTNMVNQHILAINYVLQKH